MSQQRIIASYRKLVDAMELKIRSAEEENKVLREIQLSSNQDWADDDTRVKEIAKSVGIDVEAKQIAENDDAFKGVVDVVEAMAARIKELEAKERDRASDDPRLSGLPRARDIP